MVLTATPKCCAFAPMIQPQVTGQCVTLCLFRDYLIMRYGLKRKIPLSPSLPKRNPPFVFLSSITCFSGPSKIFFFFKINFLLECVYRASAMHCLCLILCHSIILPRVLIFHTGSEFAIQCWEILCCLK